MFSISYESDSGGYAALVTSENGQERLDEAHERRRVEEVDALLERYEHVRGLNVAELAYLVDLGFGVNLRATRKRPPKMTSLMKAALLHLTLWLWRYESEEAVSEKDVDLQHLRQGMLLNARRPAGDFNQIWAGQITHPAVWAKQRRKLAGSHPMFPAIVDARATETVRRDQLGERALRLRSQLGPRFIEDAANRFEHGIDDPDAKKRLTNNIDQWNKRRRERASRLPESKTQSENPGKYAGGQP